MHCPGGLLGVDIVETAEALDVENMVKACMTDEILREAHATEEEIRQFKKDQAEAWRQELRLTGRSPAPTAAAPVKSTGSPAPLLLLAANMKGLAHGACSTVGRLGSRFGMIVALGPRSGGRLAARLASAISIGPPGSAFGSPKVELLHVTRTVRGAGRPALRQRECRSADNSPSKTLFGSR